jgi:hypothetical protein
VHSEVDALFGYAFGGSSYYNTRYNILVSNEKGDAHVNNIRRSGSQVRDECRVGSELAHL